MKRSLLYLLFTVLLILLSAAGGFAQNLSDVFDPIYDDLGDWELAGFIDPLPQMRPYAAQDVVRLLNDALEGAQPVAGSVPPAILQRMAYYKDALLNPVAPLRFIGFTQQRLARGDENQYFSVTGAAGQIIWPIADLVHLSASIYPNLVDRADGHALPAGQRHTRDWINDGANITLGDRTLWALSQVTSHLTIGSPSLHAYASITRSSFGPFDHDGIIFSPQSPFGIRFGYVWRTPTFEYNFTYRPITATTNTGAGRGSGKHTVMHSVNARILPWLELGFWETVVYGERFEPGYFVPVSSLFLSQGIVGFSDNSLLGVSATFHPGLGLRLPFQVFADDVDFNEVVKFNFNTKLKLSLQTGIQWAPGAVNIPVLRRVAFDYTAVMPYMYSHRNPDTPGQTEAWLTNMNYTNYTHAGSNMATGLPPNSDRFRLAVDAEPLTGLRLGLSLEQHRHGNASTGQDIDPATATGTIFDPGYGGSEGKTATFQPPYTDPTGQPYTRFLTQDILEYTRQLGITARWDLDLTSPPWQKSGASAKAPDSDFKPRLPQFTSGIGYTLESITNAGLISGESRLSHFFVFDLEVRW
ncbi:hypothetical protein [Spirochaeta lutea]|nr:hypothetical protein [Spirochaeta lutea]